MAARAVFYSGAGDFDAGVRREGSYRGERIGH